MSVLSSRIYSPVCSQGVFVIHVCLYIQCITARIFSYTAIYVHVFMFILASENSCSFWRCWFQSLHWPRDWPDIFSGSPLWMKILINFSLTRSCHSTKQFPYRNSGNTDSNTTLIYFRRITKIFSFLCISCEFDQTDKIVI